jgi:hypothetical protein
LKKPDNIHGTGNKDNGSYYISIYLGYLIMKTIKVKPLCSWAKPRVFLKEISKQSLDGKGR